MGLKILNFNILGGFQENEYFLGYEDFVDIFFFLGGGGWGGHHKIGLYLEVISMHFRVFSKGQGTEWKIFFSNIYLGA